MIYHFLISDSKMSWFHGKICREEAERRLKYQGDYLVRSHGNGQFVLSCMDSGHVRHLLLVDPHGQVGYFVKHFFYVFSSYIFENFTAHLALLYQHVLTPQFDSQIFTHDVLCAPVFF